MDDLKREEKEKSLKDKLKNAFYDTLPEIEWAAYFGNKNPPVIIEPYFPNSRPGWINFESALYGKIQQTTSKNSKTGEIVDEYLSRDDSGLFQSSKRVSTVLFVGFNENHEFIRRIFLSPNA